MKRFLIAVFILTACAFSIQPANAQSLAKQHRIEVRKQASFTEKKRHVVKQRVREMRHERRYERRMIRRHMVAHQMKHGHVHVYHN